MRKKDLPKIIFFEEKSGTNGIHCLDYRNNTNIKYIREDVVVNTATLPMFPNAEDVKRWFQLLVGKGEDDMQKDINATFRNHIKKL